LSAAGSWGCNGDTPAKDPSGQNVRTGDGKVVSAAAANAFNQGLSAMKAHDAAGDWDDAKCNEVASYFQKANDEQKGGTFLEALYNAGVAHQRCKHDGEAKKIFEEILGKKSEFHRARVQVALYEFQQGKDLDKAIGEMDQAIKDAEFKNEEALVHLAMLQMQRDSTASGNNCDSDFMCAKLNLQRALAINDSFMPAFNQLAVFYLEAAKKKAGRKKATFMAAAARNKKIESQALEMAALVCSQALRKDPTYAPVHNTSGLISAELGDLSAAARAFGAARKYDRKFFEAHMNYAAVNLQFRGFQQAEGAYRAALSLRPKDYEAHLGLALAVRGQIKATASNYGAKVKEVEGLLAKAKSIAPSRPETYYNEAILVQEFKARAGGAKAEPTLVKAKTLFGDFVSRAGSEDKYAEAVKRAKERIEEIDQIIAFNKQSAQEQKLMEADRKRREAEELKKTP
jgi:Tfp pilus assembly protein PilF